MTDEPEWLTIGRELQAIAQTGLSFSRDPFDLQRFERVRELAAAILASGSKTDPEIILDLFRREVGYATPKVGVRAAAFVDGRILLVQEASDGGWTLPGGWADVNQTAAECVVREIEEESGFQARAVKLLAVSDYRKSAHPPRRFDSIYTLTFFCDIVGGAPRNSNETSGVAFFARHAVPPLSLGRTTSAQVDRAFRHLENPHLPAEFD